MNKSLCLGLILFLVACGENKGRVGAPENPGVAPKASNCTVKAISIGVLIECPDGSSVTVLNGQDGKAGPTGPKGATGAIGPVGMTGATGATGPKGAIGAIGLTGAAGPAGSCTSSTPGPRGPAGPAGPKGDDGKCSEHDHEYDDNGHPKYFLCHLTEKGEYKTLKLSKEGYLAHMREHRHDFDGICNKADLCHFEH